MALRPSSNDTQVAAGPAVTEADSANELLIRARVVGDTYDRLQVTAGGAILSGAGGAAPTSVVSAGGAVAGTTVTAGAAPGLVLEDASSHPGYGRLRVIADGTEGTEFILLDNGVNLFIGAGRSVTQLLSDNFQMGSTMIGFFSATPVAQPTGVAVTAEAIHAALVLLGLITA